MNPQVSHQWESETPEAKVRWFQSLSIQERARLLDEFTELFLAAQPSLLEQNRAEPVKGRVRVLSRP